MRALKIAVIALLLWAAYVCGSVLGLKCRNPEVLRMATVLRKSSSTSSVWDEVISSAIQNELNALRAARVELEGRGDEIAPRLKELTEMELACDSFLRGKGWVSWPDTRQGKRMSLRRADAGVSYIVYPASIGLIDIELVYEVKAGGTFSSNFFSPY
jgi:hypothetical protein